MKKWIFVICNAGLLLKTLLLEQSNSFQSPGQPATMTSIRVFEISASGSIKCTHTIINMKGDKHVYTFIKDKSLSKQ